MLPEFFLALVAVQLIAASQILFKTAARPGASAAATLFQIRVFFGLALNVVAAICWVIALRKLELNFAFPLLCLNYFIIPLAARRFFGEKISAGRVKAIAVIVLGVVLCVAAG